MVQNTDKERTYEEKYRYLFHDLKYTELNRCCDFVFSYVKHTIHGNLNKDLCLVPSVEYIEKGDIVAIIAYHANITDEWIDENYIGLKQKPTLDKLRKMFDNFKYMCNICSGCVRGIPQVQAICVLHCDHDSKGRRELEKELKWVENEH